MHNNDNNCGVPWSVRTTIPILSFYLLLVLPGKNIFFHTNPLLFKYIDNVYFFVIISFALYRLNIKALGFSTKHLKNNLLIGFLSGGGLLFGLFLLNFAIDFTGLADHDLFNNRPDLKSFIHMSSTAEYAGILLAIPFIEQVFFTGIIFQSLLKKINPILAIYASGIIYSLAGFKLSLGAFGLGVVTSFLFKSTKTLYSSIIFHATCVAGGVIIKSVYPRINTLLGFLF